MYRKLGFVLAFLFALSQSSFGQIDIHGQWTGSSNWGLQKFTLKITITQAGSLLEGKVDIETLEKTN